jgi:tetratricopeptide (TPR) repeat protein
MWEIRHRHENAKSLTAGLPLLNLLLVSGLAACANTGTPGIPDTGGLGGPTGVMNVADAAIAGGDPEMALRVSQSVLATDPHNLDALYHEGEAYYVINRCMDAIAVYKVALTVDPASSNAELGIGRCLLKQNAAQAELAFAAAVRDDPGNAKALNDLGIARDLQGNRSEHRHVAGTFRQWRSGAAISRAAGNRPGRLAKNP